MQYILPTNPTKMPMHYLPTPTHILIDSLHTLWILNPHFLRLDIQVGGHVAAGRFAAVGAVAEVASWACEEFRVGDCDFYGGAEAGSC